MSLVVLFSFAVVNTFAQDTEKYFPDFCPHTPTLEINLETIYDLRLKLGIGKNHDKITESLLSHPSYTFFWLGFIACVLV